MNGLYFTLSKAQRLLRDNPKHLTDRQLQCHLVRLRDYKRYIEMSDMQRLVDGGYYGRVVDASATGLVPVDIWLHSNICTMLDEVISEREIRLMASY